MKFICYIIGPVDYIKVVMYDKTAIRIREGRENEIGNLHDFLAYAAARGCEIKCY